jgi:hypothetical protein
MFLKGITTSGVQDLDVLEACGFRQIISERKTIFDELQHRFRTEYLALLVQRKKEGKPKEFKIGDIVLVGDDNKKRLNWPLGRIESLQRGKDDNIRVATVKTAEGRLTRPLQRLYPLEVSTDEERPVVSAEAQDEDNNQYQGMPRLQPVSAPTQRSSIPILQPQRSINPIDTTNKSTTNKAKIARPLDAVVRTRYGRVIKPPTTHYKN